MQSPALAHFQKHDPMIVQLMERLTLQQSPTIEVQPKPSADFFVHLCESIIGQQLSEKAGDTIWKRFVALFEDQPITPATLLAIPDELIRQAGTSNSKVRYLKNLAESVINRQVRLDEITAMENEAVIEHLIQVKGIGQWTAEMFLMFSLGREDVFSHGDLGLKNAIKRWYVLPEYNRENIETLTAKWSPYRTFASKVLWRSLTLPKE